MTAIGLQKRISPDLPSKAAPQEEKLNTQISLVAETNIKQATTLPKAVAISTHRAIVSPNSVEPPMATAYPIVEQPAPSSDALKGNIEDLYLPLEEANPFIGASAPPANLMDWPSHPNTAFGESTITSTLKAEGIVGSFVEAYKKASLSNRLNKLELFLRNGDYTRDDLSNKLINSIRNKHPIAVIVRLIETGIKLEDVLCTSLMENAPFEVIYLLLHAEPSVFNRICVAIARKDPLEHVMQLFDEHTIVLQNNQPLRAQSLLVLAVACQASFEVIEYLVSKVSAFCGDALEKALGRGASFRIINELLQMPHPPEGHNNRPLLVAIKHGATIEVINLLLNTQHSQDEAFATTQRGIYASVMAQYPGIFQYIVRNSPLPPNELIILLDTLLDWILKTQINSDTTKENKIYINRKTINIIERQLNFSITFCTANQKPAPVIRHLQQLLDNLNSKVESLIQAKKNQEAANAVSSKKKRWNMWFS